MQRQLKPGRAIKCFAVKVASLAEQSADSDAAVQHDPNLVNPAVIDAIKFKFGF